jgi:RNA polymerase sigma factor (sigma-70 family)
MKTTQTRIALSDLHRSFRETSNTQTDLDLLARFAAGDEHAFAMLVRRHGPMVLGVCRGVLHNRADAEDAFQASFLALARKANHAFSGACLGGWLHAVARRAAGHLRKSEARRRIHERNACEMNRPAASHQADLREVLDEEVARLPHRCREAILRCYFHGQTREQAACQLGWSLRTLDRRLEQGRELLRERLTARGATLAVLLALAPVAVPSALADVTVRTALGEAPARVAELAGTVFSGFTVLRGKVLIAWLLLISLAAGSVLALLPRTNPPIRSVVAPPAQRPAARPFFEQPLPEGALARLGTTRFRHGFTVYQLAYSRDGKILASTGGGRGLCLWQAKTGQLLHHCNGQKVPSVYALAFSPDGRTIADAEDWFVRLWSVESGTELLRCTGHTDRVQSVAFAPDGNMLASAGLDKTIRLWNAGTGQQLRVLEGHTNIVNALAFRGDGQVLASASSDGTVRLWDPRSGKVLHVCKGHRKGVLALTFDAVGKRLVSSGLAGGVRLWDSSTGKQVRVLASEEGAASSLAFSSDGRILAIGRGDTIVLQAISSGKEVLRWQAHATKINTLAFSPDGKTLASGGYVDSAVHLWDPKTGKERTGAEEGHVSSIKHLAFRKDGRRLFSIGQHGRPLEWDLETRKSRSLASVWPATSYGTVFSITNDRKTLALTSGQPDKSIIDLYDLATRKKRHSLSGHKGDVLVVAFDAVGARLVSLGKDRTVRAWQVGTGAQLWQAQLRTSDPLQVGFPFFKPLAFSPDGKSVACAIDKILHLLDAATGREIRRYQHREYVFDLAWTSDSSRVAFAGGLFASELGLWDARTGELIRSWNTPQSSVLGLACSPDGRFLATGSDFDGSVYVWELATGGKAAAFDGHQCGVLQIAFAPDNRTLASGGWDSSILLWDLTQRMRNGKLPHVTISAARFAQLWEKLADTDAAIGYATLWELVAGAPGVLPMLKAKLPPAPALDARRAAKLVEQLDSGEYATRQSAMKEAEKLGLAAEPALRKALGARPALEPRRRVDALVAGWLRSADWLRYRRAIAVLEYIGSAETKQLLVALAGGAEGARPTKEAAAALGRLRNGR